MDLNEEPFCGSSNVYECKDNHVLILLCSLMELCSSDFFIVHTFFWDWIIIVTLFLFFFLLIITAINCNYAEWVQVSKIIMDFRTKARERERERFYWYMYYHFFSFFVKLIFMLKDLIKNLFCLFYFMGTCYKRSS